MFAKNEMRLSSISNQKKAAITFIEILIALAIFAIAFMPITSIISKTTRKTHELNYEIIAEEFGKSIMEQILKTIPFGRINGDITLALDDTQDIKIDVTGKTAIHRPEISGYNSGSIIKYEGAEYRWEIEVTDLCANDLPLSFWLPDNDRGARWPAGLKSTKSDGLAKAEKFLNAKAFNYARDGREILLKTIKLKISWRNAGETSNDFSDPRRKFIIVTRKARLDDDISFK